MFDCAFARRLFAMYDILTFVTLSLFGFATFYFCRFDAEALLPIY